MRTRPERREPPTPAERDEMKRAAAQFLNSSYEVLTGTGAHAEHEQRQVGRCAYCSCGVRVQGRLSRPVPDAGQQDDPYMSAEEFAGQPAAVHHAVWAAHADGKVRAVPTAAHSSVNRYDRAQVLEIRRGLEAGRG